MVGELQEAPSGARAGGDEVQLGVRAQTSLRSRRSFKNKHASNLEKKHSGFGNESKSQCEGSKPDAMLICVLW